MTSTSTTLDPTAADRTRGPAAPTCPRSMQTARRSAPSPTSFSRIRPQYSAASIGRGSAKIGLGQFEEAIADSDQALQLQPEDPDVYCSRGIAQSVPGRFRGATVDFVRTLRLAPDDAMTTTVAALPGPGPVYAGRRLPACKAFWNWRTGRRTVTSQPALNRGFRNSSKREGGLARDAAVVNLVHNSGEECGFSPSDLMSSCLRTRLCSSAMPAFQPA